MQALGPRAEKKSIANSKDVRVSIPGEQLKKVTESLKEAVEKGDVMNIKLSIAEELESESNGMAFFCNRLVQLAEDFDFDSIQNFMMKLDR